MKTLVINDIAMAQQFTSAAGRVHAAYARYSQHKRCVCAACAALELLLTPAPALSPPLPLPLLTPCCLFVLDSQPSE